MVRTPPIPRWITELRAPDGYRNPLSPGAWKSNPFPDPAHPNLWGTESLAGDWGGRLLLVFKDFAETRFLEQRHDLRPIYSHAPDFPTNRNLCRLLAAANHPLDIDGADAATCGILYASACFLLRESKLRSAPLARDALAASWPVIEFTMKNMQSLTDIVLCGADAFAAFRDLGGLNGDRLSAQNRRKPIAWRGYRVHCTNHTQPTALNTRKNPFEPNKPGFDIALGDWQVILRHAFGT